MKNLQGANFGFRDDDDPAPVQGGETVTLSGGQSMTTSSTFGTQSYSTTPADDDHDD